MVDRPKVNTSPTGKEVNRLSKKRLVLFSSWVAVDRAARGTVVGKGENLSRRSAGPVYVGPLRFHGIDIVP
jgi:hypothetical protein